MSDVYVYQTDSALVLMCGDFYIRVGDEDDLIVIVDDHPKERKLPDVYLLSH